MLLKKEREMERELRFLRWEVTELKKKVEGLEVEIEEYRKSKIKRMENELRCLERAMENEKTIVELFRRV